MNFSLLLLDRFLSVANIVTPSAVRRPRGAAGELENNVRENWQS